MIKTRDGPFTSLIVTAFTLALLLTSIAVSSARGGIGQGYGSGMRSGSSGYEGRSWSSGAPRGYSGGVGYSRPQGGFSAPRSLPSQSIPMNQGQQFGRSSGYYRGSYNNSAVPSNQGVRSGQGWSGTPNYGRRTVQPDSSRVGTVSPGVTASGQGSVNRGFRDSGRIGRSSSITPSQPGGFGRGTFQSGRSSGFGRGERFGGRFGGREEREFHQPRFSAGFFFYDFVGFSDPFFYGYWDFGYPVYANAYYSPFFCYGFPYVYGPRVVIIAPPVYVYYDVPEPYYSDYYLSPGYRSGLTEALDDIKNAWITGQSDLTLRHIDTAAKIAIYIDGKYSYSVDGTDYVGMTRDAIDHVRTVDFSIYKVSKRSDGAYTAFAKHEFYDVDNDHKTVYVSYTVLRVDDRWIIVAAGSSDNKLK